MSRQQIALEAVPSPGEPLRPMVDPSNADALRRELAERAALVAGRMTGKFVWLRLLYMRWVVARLRRRLLRGGYRAAIAARAQAVAECRKAQEAGDEDSYRAWYARGRAADATIRRLRPLAQRHDDLVGRIRAHQRAVAWEREDAQNRAAFRREVRVWAAQIESVFRQSARLHHIWIDKNGKTRMEIPKLQRVYIKEDQVYFHIRTSYQTPLHRLTDRWANALPYNVDVADLVSDTTLQNLSAACRRPVTVTWSKRGQNLFYTISRLDSPDGIPRRVLYSQIVDFYPVNQHAKTPWCLGVSSNRKTQWGNFEDTPHVLIAGSTKSGKSNMVNQMIAMLVTLNKPDEVRLLLIDLKGGIEFVHWSGLRHELRPMVKSCDDVLEALIWLRAIMERRLAAFEAMRAKNLAAYNKVAQNPLPRIICIVDEMATLIGLGKLTEEIHTQLRVLTSQGRAVGIHLVLCTQHSSVDVIPGWIKTNMGLRISGKMPSVSASQVILDTVSAATLPPVAGRMVASIGRDETVVQSPLIADDEIARAVSISQGYPEPDNSEFLDTHVPIEVVPRFGRDDLLRVALDEMGGKIAASSLFEHINDQSILTLRQARALVSQVLEEAEAAGAISYQGKTYRLRKVGRAYFMVEVEQAGKQQYLSAGD